MRVASFSVLHSNLPALEAVLADIAAVEVDQRYALGDPVGYAPWSNEVLERLQADKTSTAIGNYDRAPVSTRTSAADEEDRSGMRGPGGAFLGDLPDFGWA